MMNPFERKMFNSKPSRPARNKLNQMGGIMASSVPLMQGVQKFATGGSTSSVQIPNFRSIRDVALKGYVPDMSREEFLNASPEVQRKLIEAEQNRRTLNRGLASVAEPLLANPSDAIMQPLAGVVNYGIQGLKKLGFMNPASTFNVDQPRSSLNVQELSASNPALPARHLSEYGTLSEQAQAYAGLLATENNEFFDPKIKNAIDFKNKTRSQRDRGTADELEARRQKKINDGSSVDDGDLGSPVDTIIRSPVDDGDLASTQTLNASVDTIVGSPVDDGDLADTQTLNASVENSAANELQRVFNQGTPEEVEKSLEELMLEFTSAAPERKGLDKGLAIAKIGFAMAAGQSPNAISNIASALSSGAGMFIKDKSEKDSFDRQVQLSALQYGIGEVGKRRQEGRIEDRERRGVKEYVAGPEGVTYNGKKYNENETVPVLIGDIRDGNMPSGLISSAMVSAIATKSKAVAEIQKEILKGVQKKEEDFTKSRQITVKDLTAQQDRYREAANIALTSENAIGLLETVFVDISEGKVTGASAGLKDALNKASNFFGFKLDESYETKEAAQSAMRMFLQDLIPVTLGSSQSANSISNRDVEFLIGAFFGDKVLDDGSFQFVLKDDNQLLKRLQRAADKMRESQKGAFAEMREIENTLEPLFQPGTRESAVLSLSEQNKRLKEKGLSISGTTTGTTIGTNVVDSEKTDDKGRPIFKII